MVDDDGRRRLGRLILRARESKGWERKDLAGETGLSYPYVAQIENGDREPSLRALQSLATALSLPVSDLTTALETEAPSTTARSRGYVSNPAYSGAPPPLAAAAPIPDPTSQGSLRRAKGSSARRSLVAEVHELLERVDPLERLAVLGELQGLVLADVVRAEVNNRMR